MSSEVSVLVLEDEPDIAAMISGALTRDGWRVSLSSSLAEARARLEVENPRIVVADLGLPDGNGITFVREVALRGGCGIMVVSGRGEEVDRVVGLEVGADDYLTKPFSLREMVARVRALHRRLGQGTAPQAHAAPPPAELGRPQSWDLAGIRLEPARQRVVGPGGAEVRLTGGEARLLELLLTEPENIADRDTISQRVLGHPFQPEQRGPDNLASNLRQKLSAVSGGALTVAAVRGRGYRLVW